MLQLDDYSDQAVLDLIARIDAAVNPLLDHDTQDLTLIFAEAARRKLPVNPSILARWISAVRPPGWSQPGLAAMKLALSNDVPEVRQALHSALNSGQAEIAIQATLTLAQLHDTSVSSRITDMLPALQTTANSLLFGRACVALGMLGETTAAIHLQAMIATAPDWATHWLARAIHDLTGFCPPPPSIDPETYPKAYCDQMRHDWARLDLSKIPTPTVRSILTPSHRAEVVVGNGRDIFTLAPDAPDGLSDWPESTFSWCHSGERLYETGGGAICSTCAVVLQRIGWAPGQAVRLTQVVRGKVADVETLDTALLKALRPLLAALAAGRYQLRLVDLPLEATTWADTWYADCEYGSESADLVSPLYQLPHDADAIPFVIAPTQDPGATDPSTVTDYMRHIKEGQHPAAVVAAYSSQRQAWNAKTPQRSITGFIIDGHHKIAAYTALGIPCRVILICDRTPRQPPHTKDPLAIFDELLPDKRLLR